jgi:hypothetical protein
MIACRRSLTCPVPLSPLSRPFRTGEGRGEGDSSGLFSVKQRVPSRGGSTTSLGQVPSETKCPDPPANLFPPVAFFELFSMKQRVPSRRRPKVQDCEHLILDPRRADPPRRISCRVLRCSPARFSGLFPVKQSVPSHGQGDCRPSVRRDLTWITPARTSTAWPRVRVAPDSNVKPKTQIAKIEFLRAQKQVGKLS